MTTNFPLWGDRPNDKALPWYIRVPDSLRHGMRGNLTEEQPEPPLDSAHLPMLVALHGLLPHRTAADDGMPSGELIISPAALSTATGVEIPTLKDRLDGCYPADGPEPRTTRLRPHAWLERTFEQDNPDLLEDEDDTGERWVIGVNRPTQGAWMQVPAWWLFARTRHTLLGGRQVERRAMRRLSRDPTTGAWASSGPGANPSALLGALMVTERLHHKATIPQIHTWATPTLGKRWGVSPATAHRAMKAAEEAGFVASRRRSGGNGRPARRRLVQRPTDPQGERLPPGWGNRRAAGEGTGS